MSLNSKLSEDSRFDVCVVGGGSGGIGATIAAARGGLRVVLIERAPTIGGNAVRGGVNCWEMGVGGTGLPFEIYKRLKRRPKSVGIYRFARHLWHLPDFPGGEAVLDSNLRYIDSLRRFLQPGEVRLQVWHGVPFEPAAYEQVVAEMLAEAGDVTLLTGSAVVEVMVANRCIRAVVLENDTTISADTFIDSTAEVHLARMAGCLLTRGRENRSTYNETGAPEIANSQLNAITQIYRADYHGGSPVLEPLPADVPSECWWREGYPSAVFNEYPSGGWNINMLPTMEASEFSALGEAAAKIECERRIRAHWHWVQTVLPEMQLLKLSWIAPALGVREGARLVGRYVLTQHDLDQTLKEQTHDDIICIADHSRDVHGEAHVGKELRFPYGVPFRCLLPQELDNVAVACRGASFSSIGASSCRLSRTMMQLGQAAGTAAALAKKDGFQICDVSGSKLRKKLRSQKVQLEWPAPADLQAYLEDEDA